MLLVKKSTLVKEKVVKEKVVEHSSAKAFIGARAQSDW